MLCVLLSGCLIRYPLPRPYTIDIALSLHMTTSSTGVAFVSTVEGNPIAVEGNPITLIERR